MMYSAKEVMQYIREEDVKFIRLAFCDVSGNQKNVSVMPYEIQKAFDSGIGIDASAIYGFGGEVYSDLLLHPDPSTISVLPWRPEHGKVIRMFCSITHPDGRPFESDSRRILKNAVKSAMARGYTFSFGAEIEFYLFKTDENGNPTNEPFDNAGYLDIAPMDKGENVRREICLTLEKMGIRPECSHHEVGPGQNEIDFLFSDPLTAADNAVTFLSVVRTIAARNGLYADFSPKPIEQCAGNSYHINMSIKSTGDDGDCLPYAIAGIMNRISDTTVFFNPIEDSYKRLGKCMAPKYITWSPENRSQLIRIPADRGEYRRLELRSPDPCTNPYIAYAILIYSALEGLENRELPPDASNFNLYALSAEEESKFRRLPESLGEAKKLAAASEFVKKILPQNVTDTYCK